MKRRLAAIGAGIAGALAPLATFAQEHGGAEFEAASRATDPGADWGVVMLITVIATGALFLLAAIGYAYRRERNLEWAFQKPDAPHADHGAH